MAKKILIADDEPDFVMMLRKRLEDKGYEVDSVSNGEEVIESARSKKPDIIILDIMMPKIDGTEAARKLDADERTKGIPIIFITALKTKEEEDKHGHEDKHVTFAKPFEPDKLLSKIDELTSGKSDLIVRFLIVDTSAVMRKMIVDTIFQGKTFNATNTRIYEAGNGKEGLESYKANKPHIVLTNWKLPELDGLEMTKQIRELDAHIPIILITTEGMEDKVKDLVTQGKASDFVVKPIRSGLIEEKLTKAFQKIKGQSG